MIITSLEELDKKKVKVYIDGEYAFLLYQKEISHYKLAQEMELSDALYEEIRKSIVLRRAKQKALDILKMQDRTEKELRRKLADAHFTEDIIEEAVAYINSYGYLNDERLAASYVRNRMNIKSKLMIKQELLQKGVDSEVINKVFQEEYGDTQKEDAELTAIKKAVAKKTKDPESLNYEEKQKLIASLYRKGFDLGKIRKIVEESEL
jgi:regulatory protein